MYKILCFLALVSAACAASIGKSVVETTTEKREVVPLVRYETDRKSDGSFSFSFEGGDKSSRQETGVVENVGTEEEALEVHGSYKYIDADGQEVEVHYTAGKNGFVPIGTNINPAISDAAKAAADLPKAEEIVVNEKKLSRMTRSHKGGEKGGEEKEGKHEKEHKGGKKEKGEKEEKEGKGKKGDKETKGEKGEKEVKGEKGEKEVKGEKEEKAHKGHTKGEKEQKVEKEVEKEEKAHKESKGEKEQKGSKGEKEAESKGSKKSNKEVGAEAEEPVEAEKEEVEQAEGEKENAEQEA